MVALCCIWELKILLVPDKNRKNIYFLTNKPIIAF